MTTNSHRIESGSLLDGINIAAPKKAKRSQSLRERLNAFGDSWEWTPKRKRNAAIALCVLSMAALGAGGWLMVWLQPPGLPKTPQEAIAVMASAKFDRLDESQKAEYEDEANKLIATLPWEERRELFKNDRESMEKLMERNMDEMARKFARGETPEFPMGPGGGGGRFPQGRPDGGDRGPRPDGGGPGAGGPGGGGNGGGGGPGGGGRGDASSRHDGAVRRVNDRVSKGNPQSNGLMGQMRQAMQQQRGPR